MLCKLDIGNARNLYSFIILFDFYTYCSGKDQAEQLAPVQQIFLGQYFFILLNQKLEVHPLPSANLLKSIY